MPHVYVNKYMYFIIMLKCPIKTNIIKNDNIKTYPKAYKNDKSSFHTKHLLNV